MNKILSVFLALSMAVTLLPVWAMAEGADTPIDTSGEIIAFAPLAETEKTVAVGTSIEDLELPEILTATVRTAVASEEEPVRGPGEPEDTGETSDPEWEETTVDIPVTWTSAPEYDMDAEGKYAFTPVIEGYTMSAELPQIKVTVGEMLSITAAPTLLGAEESITVNDETELNAAIENVAEGGNIVLGANIILTNTVEIPSSIGKSFTLDLNGKTLSCDRAILKHQGTGTLTITGGKGGGTIYSSMWNAISNDSSGSLIISGITIESNYATGIINSSSGTVSVSGSTISGGINNTGISNSFRGTVKVFGATSIIAGGVMAMNTAPTLDGVTVTASANASGTPPVDYDAASISTYKYLKFEPAPTAINGIGYPTLQAAVDDVADGQTITLLDDIALGNIVTIAEGSSESFTLDLNGKTITSNSDGVIEHKGSGTLTITDCSSEGGGTVQGYSYTILSSGNGKIFVSGKATISSHSWQAIYISGAGASAFGRDVLEIAGGTVSSDNAVAIQNITDGNVVVSSGTVTGNDVGISSVYNVGSVTVSGGNVKGGNIAIFTSGDVVLTDGTVECGESSDQAIHVRKVTIVPVGTVVVKGAIYPFLQPPILPADNTSYQWRTASDGDFAMAPYVWKSNHTYVEIKPYTAPDTYTITATAGTGGSIFPSGSVAVDSGGLQIFTITPNSNYSVADVTVDGVSQGKITRYTFHHVAADHTISATFSYNGGGGSGSGGGSTDSSPIIVAPPTTGKPNFPTKGEINVPGTVDSKGNVSVNITSKIMTAAFEKALAEARKIGNERNGITAVLRVGTGSRTGSHVTVNLPKAVQDTILAKKIVNTIVMVDNPDIRIGMDLAAVREIKSQAKSDANITAARADSGKLTGEAKNAIGGRPLFDLKVNYGSGKQVQSFGAGSVSVAIPYTLGANEKAGNVQAVYVDGNGKMHWLANSVYDSAEKVLRFNTNHFSTYGIGYKQPNTAFTDIANHWAKEDIEFAVSRGLLGGTSAATFSPNTAITRGMFVTALGRLANADISSYKKSGFTDVKSDAYYMGYIEWANKNGIATGVGNGTFAPDQSITREQIAVILQNYAKAIGFTPPKVHTESTFADSAKISTNVKDAVKQMQMAGVISGKKENLFDPQNTATRAEVAAVLHRFAELVIFSDTMQGWMRNDSGQLMYYKNGKPVTGKKNIGGTAYTFDQYGVTADVPKNLRYTTYTVQKGDSFWNISRKLGCSMSELERLNNKSRFSLILPGEVLRIPEK